MAQKSLIANTSTPYSSSSPSALTPSRFASPTPPPTVAAPTVDPALAPDVDAPAPADDAPAPVPDAERVDTTGHAGIDPYFGSRQCKKWNFGEFVFLTYETRDPDSEPPNYRGIWEESLQKIITCKDGKCCPPAAVTRAKSLAKTMQATRVRYFYLSF